MGRQMLLSLCLCLTRGQFLHTKVHKWEVLCHTCHANYNSPVFIIYYNFMFTDLAELSIRYHTTLHWSRRHQNSEVWSGQENRQIDTLQTKQRFSRFAETQLKLNQEGKLILKLDIKVFFQYIAGVFLLRCVMTEKFYFCGVFKCWISYGWEILYIEWIWLIWILV